MASVAVTAMKGADPIYNNAKASVFDKFGMRLTNQLSLQTGPLKLISAD